MSAEDTAFWQRAADLFDRLLEHPPAGREAALAQACGEDAALAAAVSRLLLAHHRAVGDSVGVTSGDGAPAGVARAIEAWAQQAELAADDRVGPFRVVRALGAGGMGQVYLAERDVDGRRQPVALKLPRHGLSAAFLQRFRRERAILAQLAHPAIARLIDAGELQDGRPWLAMEYVEGEPILDWCQRQKTDLRTRIRLVVAILDALQHAHARLVLHRDIKSANVLVDDTGQPRLLDFGIGKELGEDAVAATQDGLRYFTLGSAAPEQVRGAPSSAATDVYAVGVLAYRLLAEAMPIEFHELDPPAALQQVLNRVPPLASAAVAALEDARRVEAAAHRRLRPAAWIAALRGDLDVVLARALRKEPGQRYPTAQAFGDDLRAVLESRPIAARSSESWYRMQRFLRRHALAVSLGGALLLSLTAFVGYTLVQSAALRLARDEAEQRQQQAELARDQAEQVTAFLKGLFEKADPREARGRDQSASDLLKRGVQALKEGGIDSPALRADLLETLSDIHLSLGEFDPADALAREAFDLRLADPVALRRSHEQMARMKSAKGDYEGALEHLHTLLGDLSEPGPEVSDDQLRWLFMQASAKAGRGAPALESLRRFEALAKAYRERFGAQHPRTVSVLRRLAMSFTSAGRTEDANAIDEELTRNLQLSEDDPQVALLAGRRARLMRRLGQLDEARRLAQWALRVDLGIYGEKHQLVIQDLAVLAGVEKDAGQLEAAQAAYGRALAIAAQVLPAESMQRAGLHFSYATFLRDARKDAPQALAHFEAAVSSFAPGPAQSSNEAVFRKALGVAYGRAGRERDALTQLRSAQAYVAAQGDAFPVESALLEALVNCLSPERERPAGAREQFQLAITRMRDADPQDSMLGTLQACLDNGAFPRD